MKNIKLSFKNSIKRLAKMVAALTVVLANICYFSIPAYATSIADSNLAKGTEKLIQDATTWLMILSPIVGVLLIIYFFIRRSIADEMDIKKWNNRIIATIISCVGAVLTSAMLNIIITYYS